jgi:hypothetical protein
MVRHFCQALAFIAASHGIAIYYIPPLFTHGWPEATLFILP